MVKEDRSAVDQSFAVWLSLVVLCGCADQTEKKGVHLYTFAVGTFDGAGEFTPSDVVSHEIGKLFGYELAIHSTSGKVRVREVLELPEPGVWSDNDTAPPGVNVLEQRASEDGKTHIEEFEIECGDKMYKLGQVYEIVDGDPTGAYKFSIYLDGELAEEAELRVQKVD